METLILKRISKAQFSNSNSKAIAGGQQVKMLKEKGLERVAWENTRSRKSAKKTIFWEKFGVTE